MSDEKQKEVLSGYEQLKRRNRRRLVITSALVFVSGILLAMALNTEADGEQAVTHKTVTAENRTETGQGDAARAAVLEPSENDEQVRQDPQAAVENTAAVSEPPVEVLRPEPPQTPEDTGPPLVIINDKLVDSDIKGLEESEKIQKAETAKREALEHKEQARLQRQAEQRAAKRAQERKAALEKEAAEKKRLAARNEKAERDATAAKRKQDQEAAAERKAKQAAAEKKEAAKPKAAEQKKTAAKEPAGNTANNAKAVKPSEKSKPAEKSAAASKERAAIQAGYAEKERAQSLQRKMKAAGINASITEIKTDKGVVYRVKSSSYNSRQQAARDLEKLRVHGIAGQVVDE